MNEYIAGKKPACEAQMLVDDVFQRQVLVPAYYDRRYNSGIEKLLQAEGVEGTTIGELIDQGTVRVRGGHGSPSNDQRTGSIPYVKVSDIRGLRVNVNPTNLVSEVVARRFWRGTGLKAPSLVRLGFLAVLPEGRLLGTIGFLSSERHRRLLKRLRTYLIQESG